MIADRLVFLGLGAFGAGRRVEGKKIVERGTSGRPRGIYWLAKTGQEGSINPSS
jgi:hypothetical protein